MAATRLITMHGNKGKTIAQCLNDRTEYAKNGEKTEQGKFLSSYACNAAVTDKEFLLAREEYLRNHRKPAGEIIAYQIRQSFKPGEVTPEEANQVGYETAIRFTKGKHAFFVATHTDKAHIHNHIIFNSVNLSCDRKFRDFFFVGIALQRVSDLVCLEHGLSVIQPKKPSERQKRIIYPKRESFRSMLCEDIEAVLLKSPENYEEFLKLLMEQGYEIKRGKNVAVRGNGQKRFIRLQSLADGYTERDIRKILEEKKELVEQNEKRKDIKSASPKKLDLLIEIQELIQKGKGEGYTRWAKVYNIKQISAALLFLQEHGVRDYESLEEIVNTTTRKFHELSDVIKQSEKQLAEIGVLRTHIINYAKTRDIYVAYRKAGYSKRFFEEHREALTLHKAAKKAFADLKGTKIPRIKELNQKYARVQSEKKAAYGEYRELKKQMQDYLIAKQNIDMLLQEQNQKEQSSEKEKENMR